MLHRRTCVSSRDEATERAAMQQIAWLRKTVAAHPEAAWAVRTTLPPIHTIHPFPQGASNRTDERAHTTATAHACTRCGRWRLGTTRSTLSGPMAERTSSTGTAR